MCDTVRKLNFLNKSVRGETHYYSNQRTTRDTKRKPRTQGSREVTTSHQMFTILARSGPNSCKTKSRA